MMSLAYILKNEEDYIERSIMSARDVFDEIVVLDTGSSDRTVEICQSLGATVFHHEWKDDFSEARNVLKSKCRGDWIMMLDADEHLEGENLGLIREAVAMASENSIVAYQLPRKHHYPLHDSNSPYFSEPFYPDFQARLFANLDEIYFSGRVHEGVLQSIAASGVGLVGKVYVTIHHHIFRGDKENNESIKGKYYEMLSKMDSEHENGEDNERQ